MGRGRAKAKQTKVARELKYHSGGTDLERLRAELAGEPAVRPVESEPAQIEDEYADPYADDLDDSDEDSDDENDPTGQDHRTA
jgi:Protein of unknown function (DUF3073)